MATIVSSCIKWFWHVTQCAGGVVIAGALPTPRFGHGDLHVVDVVAVPDGLDHGIGEAEHQQVLHGLLTEVVVDAVDLLLVKVLVQAHVQLAGTLEVFAKRLLDHDPVAAVRAADADTVELFDHTEEIGRLDGEIKDDILAAEARLAALPATAGRPAGR